STGKTSISSTSPAQTIRMRRLRSRRRAPERWCSVKNRSAGPPPKRRRRTAAKAQAMFAAVDGAGVPNMVCYNYRRVPAVVLLKELIDQGKLGRIFHYRAQFLQDWTISRDLPQGR